MFEYVIFTLGHDLLQSLLEFALSWQRNYESRRGTLGQWRRRE
jgi:hypothetical protein